MNGHCKGCFRPSADPLCPRCEARAEAEQDWRDNLEPDELAEVEYLESIADRDREDPA